MLENKIYQIKEIVYGGKGKMEQYKKEFIEFMVDSDVLKFGEFTLKSGRKSPFACSIKIGKVSSIDLPEVVTSSIITTLSPSFKPLPSKIPTSP